MAPACWFGRSWWQNFTMQSTMYCLWASMIKKGWVLSAARSYMRWEGCIRHIYAQPDKAFTRQIPSLWGSLWPFMKALIRCLLTQGIGCFYRIAFNVTQKKCNVYYFSLELVIIFLSKFGSTQQDLLLKMRFLMLKLQFLLQKWIQNSLTPILCNSNDWKLLFKQF